MSEEEFKSLIKFRTDNLGGDRNIRKASIQFSRAMAITNGSDSKSDVIKQVDERLTEDLLRRVYTDRREELHCAIMQLNKVPLMNYSRDYYVAVENILKIAKRQ